MSYILNAKPREIKGEKTRAGGALPAVVYGAGLDTASLELGYRDFEKLYQAAGEASLIDMVLDGKKAGKVLVQSVQHDPVRGGIIHVDLRRIDMDKKMHAQVSLNLIGEAPVIKAEGGTLVSNVDTVEVECLPKDLVSQIDVSLEGLTSFEDIIKVADLQLPPGLVIVNPHADDVLIKPIAPLTEDQIKAMEDAAQVADVSKIEVDGEKKEEAEGEEGETAAEDDKKDSEDKSPEHKESVEKK